MSISRLSEVPEEVLKLPENFTHPEKRIKLAPGPTDFSVLTEEQMEQAEQIMNYVEGKSQHRMYTLMGYAGTGKTFMLSKLENWMLYAKKYKVAVSCPTNKAVQICRDMAEIADPKLTFATIHSLLGLKEQRDYHGRLSFVPDPKNPPNLQAYDILIIDETSMLDDSLFKLIEPFINEGLKIIFVGDPAQIPPVNRIDCIPFIKAKQRQYGIACGELKNILRQAEDNPLLHFATQIREQRSNQEFDYKYETVVKNSAGLVIIEKEDRETIYKICETYFANDIFESYPDFMKVIAYRNVTVNAINKKVRSLIYKQEDLPALMVGEKMIADEPIKEETGRFIILTTNQEFVVQDYQVASTHYNGWCKNVNVVSTDFMYYHTTIRYMSNNGYKDARIMILHEDSYQNYTTALEELKLNALSLTGFDRIDGWKAYYALHNFFAKVKYNYAITAHKSQGSTFENCMMLEWDMYQNTRYEERNRIRYVAATRARKYLFIVK